MTDCLMVEYLETLFKLLATFLGVFLVTFYTTDSHSHITLQICPTSAYLPFFGLLLQT